MTVWRQVLSIRDRDAENQDASNGDQKTFSESPGQGMKCRRHCTAVNLVLEGLKLVPFACVPFSLISRCFKYDSIHSLQNLWVSYLQNYDKFLMP